MGFTHMLLMLRMSRYVVFSDFAELLNAKKQGKACRSASLDQERARVYPSGRVNQAQREGRKLAQ